MAFYTASWLGLLLHEHCWLLKYPDLPSPTSCSAPRETPKNASPLKPNLFHLPEKNLCTSSVEQDQGSPLTFTTYPSLLSVFSITLEVRFGSASVSVVAAQDQSSLLEPLQSIATTRTPQSARRTPGPALPLKPPLPRTAARLTHTEPLPPTCPRPAPIPARTHGGAPRWF